MPKCDIRNLDIYNDESTQTKIRKKKFDDDEKSKKKK